jgi:hypothetical protein
MRAGFRRAQRLCGPADESHAQVRRLSAPGDSTSTIRYRENEPVVEPKDFYAVLKFEVPRCHKNGSYSRHFNNQE